MVEEKEGSEDLEDSYMREREICTEEKKTGRQGQHLVQRYWQDDRMLEADQTSFWPPTAWGTQLSD